MKLCEKSTENIIVNQNVLTFLMETVHSSGLKLSISANPSLTCPYYRLPKGSWNHSSITQLRYTVVCCMPITCLYENG